MNPDRSSLAPWHETFVLHARLHEVPGPRIGEALAEIDTHCRDSGQSPAEAFGDPVDYAHAVAHGPAPGDNDESGSTGPRRRTHRYLQRRPGPVGLNAAATLAGVLLLLSGVAAVAEGERGAVTVGELVAVLAGSFAVVYIALVILRPGRRQLLGPLLAALTAGLGLVVAPQLLWEQPVLRPPGWALLATGGTLLGLAWWPLMSGRLFADRIIDPRTGDDAVPTPRWVVNWLRWGLPLLVVLVGITAVLSIVLTAT